MQTKLFTLLLVLMAACTTEVSSEANQGAAGSVGVDKEALTVTLNSWMGITTESQVKQGLHCLTLAYPALNNRVGQPTCSDITANPAAARCIVTAGPQNGKEARVSMTGTNPLSSNMLLSGVNTNLWMKYTPTSSWPKTYTYTDCGSLNCGSNNTYTCTVACVPPQCAGVQATWTAPLIK
jgi:hypothetical protein